MASTTNTVTCLISIRRFKQTSLFITITGFNKPNRVATMPVVRFGFSFHCWKQDLAWMSVYHVGRLVVFVVFFVVVIQHEKNPKNSNFLREREML